MQDFIFRREAICFGIILALGISLFIPSIYAQDEVEKKEPQPIPTADILKEAEAASLTLNKMSTLL